MWGRWMVRGRKSAAEFTSTPRTLGEGAARREEEEERMGRGVVDWLARRMLEWS
jgi:hypothetical protein